MSKIKIFVVLIVIAVILGAWWFSVNNNNPKPDTINNSVSTPIKTKENPRTLDSFDFSGSQIDTSSWLTYKNEEEKYSFKYPQDWLISKNEEIGLVNVLAKIYPKDVSVWVHSINDIQDFNNAEKVFKNSLPVSETYTWSTSTDTYSLTVLGYGNENGGALRMFVTNKSNFFEIGISSPDTGYSAKYIEVAIGLQKTLGILK